MKPNVQLQWITPEAEVVIMRNARKSSKDPTSDNVKLLDYLIKHKHWSPFEMATMCVDIETSRTIARQILRHRSFSFQEFSQRYQDVEVLENDMMSWEARLENPKNRQSSLPIISDAETNEVTLNQKHPLQEKFEALQARVRKECLESYREAIKLGIAREQARCLLPEGLTKTRMSMSGSIRSWIHYINIRCHEDTQKEHRLIAEAVKDILIQQCPYTSKALGF